MISEFEQKIQIEKMIVELFNSLDEMEKEIVSILSIKNQMESNLSSLNKDDKKFKEIKDKFENFMSIITPQFIELEKKVKYEYEKISEYLKTSNDFDNEFMKSFQTDLYNRIVEFQMITGLNIVETD